jgi:hypothetical protein
MNTKTCFIVTACLFSFAIVKAQVPIGIIEVYGNRSISAATIAEALSFKVGDTINRQIAKKNHETERLKKVLHVPYVNIESVCCTERKEEILFIGIGENNTSQLSFRKAPAQPLFLPTEMVVTYDAFINSVREAVLKNQAGEDLSQGHSLMAYAPSRELQKKFIGYASDPAVLRSVLREAADHKQRAIAAHIIAYAADKRAVVDDLLFAVDDPDEEVRNNAARALSVIAFYASEHPELQMQIPAQPFIHMLNSVSWTDRNKAALVLFHLSSTRNPKLFQQLKEVALPALLEMAQWKSKQHAFLYYIILGRMAGLDDEKLFTAFSSDQFANTLNEVVANVKATK